MIDKYLRAADQATMDAALASVRNAQGNPLDGVCIDVIGAIPSVSGYHANVRFLVAPTQAQLDALAGVTVVPPVTPFRVWMSV